MHEEVTRGHDPFFGQQHHDVAARIAAAQPSDVDRTLAAMQHEPVDQRQVGRGVADFLDLGNRRSVHLGNLPHPRTPPFFDRLAVVVLARRGPAGELLVLLLHIRDDLRARRIRLVEDVGPGVAVRNELHLRPQVLIHLVSLVVIVVPVRVDDVPDRLRGQLAQRGGHAAGARGKDPRVHHDHVAVVDDEQGIALDRLLGRIPPHEAVHAFGELHDVVGLGCGRAGVGRTECGQGGEQSRQGAARNAHATLRSRECG